MEEFWEYAPREEEGVPKKGLRRNSQRDGGNAETDGLEVRG